MLGKSISGTNKCFVCNHDLNWATTAMSSMSSGVFVVQDTPEVTAEEIATGRNQDGTVNFDIICTCPGCKTKNKFTITK